MSAGVPMKAEPAATCFSALSAQHVRHQLVVARIVLGAGAGEPFLRGIGEALEMLVAGAETGRHRLVAGRRAAHEERVHHMAVAGMAGLPPRVAIGADQARASWSGSSGIAITLQPLVPAKAKVSGVLVAAIQNGGCGRCVGRGNDVTLAKLLNSPLEETFSSFSSIPRRNASPLRFPPP